MALVKPIKTLTPAMLAHVITGYTSPGRYIVAYLDTPAEVIFSLKYESLPAPIVRQYDHYQTLETLQRYNEVLVQDYSYGAFEGELLLGLLLAEPRPWNKSVWVWEFHVIENYRRQGIGRQLMERLVVRANRDGLRTIVCETQNVNTVAIAAYRRMGFRPEGVDISYYSNEDYPDGDIAIFMKRQLK